MGLAFFAILFVLAFIWQNQTQQAVLRRVEATRPARLPSAALIQALIDVETGERGYLLPDDPAFLRPYADGRARLAAQLSGLRRTAANQNELAAAVARVQISVVSAAASIDHT